MSCSIDDVLDDMMERAAGTRKPKSFAVSGEESEGDVGGNGEVGPKINVRGSKDLNNAVSWVDEGLAGHAKDQRF